jgi:hypothetical protein
LEFATDAQMHSKLFEDNNGALGLALSQRMNFRTKYIAHFALFYAKVVPTPSLMVNCCVQTKGGASIYHTFGLYRYT